MIRMMIRPLVLIGLMLSSPVLALRSADTKLPDAGSSDEIIVQALKIPRGKLPVNVQWTTQNEIPSRIAYERADQFFTCAMRKVDQAKLREAVEGPPNFASTRYAQGMVIVTNFGCYPPRRYGVSSDPIDYGGDLLDRGILIERTLRAYLPNATLNVSQTLDPAVRERFLRTEMDHNRYRLGPTVAAFSIASCLVQVQPELATRLVHAEQGSPLVRGLEQAMIVNAPQCIEGRKKIVVEPTTSRLYIVEAFYRWLMAARNASTLIPHTTT